MSHHGRGDALAAAKLAKAMRIAGTNRVAASGAVLGTVIEGDTPTLTVKLDSGQEVPQCMGELQEPNTRVLCFWVNEGHDLAVLLAGAPYVPPYEPEPFPGLSWWPLKNDFLEADGRAPLVPDGSFGYDFEWPTTIGGITGGDVLTSSVTIPSNHWTAHVTYLRAAGRSAGPFPLMFLQIGDASFEVAALVNDYTRLYLNGVFIGELPYYDNATQRSVLAFTYNFTELKIYVAGALVYTRYETINASAGPVLLGTQGFPLQHLAVYNYVLTADEVNGLNSTFVPAGL